MTVGFNGIPSAITITSGSVTVNGTAFVKAGTGQVIKSQYIASGGTGSAVTLLTVTAGKTFYLSSITMHHNNGSPQVLDIGDNGTLKMSLTTTGAQAMCYWSSVVPMTFTTNIQQTFVNGATGKFTITGWEE